MFYGFIWGKREKIKRCVLINKYDHGGMQMLDTESLFKSVQAAWAVRIINASMSEKWCYIAKSMLKYDNNNGFIFKLYFNSKHCENILDGVSDFYKVVLLAFNEAKSIDEEAFISTLLDQPIWANCNIAVKLGRRYKTLFFQSWIKSNIIKLSNLKFVNGKLDQQFILDKVADKRNILSEISLLVEALRPYRQYLNNSDHVPDTELPYFWKKGQPFFTFTSAKSKMFYDAIVSQKVERNRMEEYWTRCLQKDDIDFKRMYIDRICAIKDKQLAEFNFKVINGILPCNVNLVRWRKGNTKKCNICNGDESIEHLLYYCKYASAIWESFSETLDVDLSVDDILVGNNQTIPFNFLISLVSFLIYKSWLLESMKNKPRIYKPSISMFKPDLLYRSKIYQELQWLDIVILINMLVH